MGVSCHACRARPGCVLHAPSASVPPVQAARYGFIDDVILPRHTRARLAAELALLRDKQVRTPRRKHGNPPL